MVAVLDVISGAVRVAFAPKERLHVDEWADRYRVLPRTVSAHHGRWDTNLTPYLRRIMRLWTHEAVRHLTEEFGSQLGKSESIECCKGYIVDCEPRNTIVMFPTIDDARDWNQDRFMPMLEQSPRLARHIPSSPQDSKAAKITFASCIFYYIGSNSLSGRRMRPAPNLFLDEVSAYQDPDYIEIYDRVKGGDGTHKIFDTGTPQDEDTGIDEVYKKGSQEHYYVPCPHCRAYRTLVFQTPDGRGLRWDGGGRASPDEAKATARYVCDACGGEIFNWQKPAMLAAGVWVPKCRTVEDVLENGEGSVAGTGRGNHTGIEREHCSFQLSSLYSPFAGGSWGEMAAAFVTGGGVMTPSFCRGWMGEPWVVERDRVEVEDLKRLAVSVKDEGYRIGEVPLGVMSIVRGVDVQKDWAYIVDIGIGERMRDIWLVNFLKVPRKKGLCLRDVFANPMVPSAYKARNAQEFKVMVEFLDSGHFTEEVYLAVQERRKILGNLRCWAVKGKKRDGAMAQPHRKFAIDYVATEIGKKRIVMEGLEVNSDYWKTAVTSRIAGTAVAEREGEEDAGTAMGFYLPEMDEGPGGGRVRMFIEQVTAEHRKLETDKRGRKTYVWAMRPRGGGGGENHGFDAMCYAMCGADFAGGKRMGRKKK